MTALLAAPKPTTDLARAEADLAEHGACIIKDVLTGEVLEQVRDALIRVATGDQRRGWANPYATDGDVNQRVWNLPSRDDIFCDLVEHPLALRFVQQILGWPALLSGSSANIVWNGGGGKGIHADMGYMPFAPGSWEIVHGINVAWAIDDFTLTNGATSFVPGSHRLKRPIGPDDTDLELVPFIAPAGSMLVMDGRLWHTNGVNTDGTRRAAIFNWYTLPVYLPQENWYLSLNPIIRQCGSETLLTLLGFRPGILARPNGFDRV